MSSGSGRIPSAAHHLDDAVSSLWSVVEKPSVGPYWSAAPPTPRNPLSVCGQFSGGKWTVSGSRPLSEITSGGRVVTPSVTPSPKSASRWCARRRGRRSDRAGRGSRCEARRVVRRLWDLPSCKEVCGGLTADGPHNVRFRPLQFLTDPGIRFRDRPLIERTTGPAAAPAGDASGCGDRRDS